MATAFPTQARRDSPISADRYERMLALSAGLLLAAALAAIVRGRAEWGEVPALIWLHLLTIVTATALTPLILLRRRGDRRHRLLGRVWVIAMLTSAALTLGISVIRPGHWSWIHLLSLYVLACAPRLWWAARAHRVPAHRAIVRGMVTGALVIAGFFTFPFGRMLGRWLFV